MKSGLFYPTCPRCGGRGEIISWDDDGKKVTEREYRCWVCSDHRYPSSHGHLNAPLPDDVPRPMTTNPPKRLHLYGAHWHGELLDETFVRLTLSLGFGMEHTELFRLTFVQNPMEYAPLFIRQWMSAGYQQSYGHCPFVVQTMRERRDYHEYPFTRHDGPYACVIWRKWDGHCLNEDLVFAGCAQSKPSEEDIPPDWTLV